MRMIPIDVEIELAVCANDFDEAVAAVKCGLAEGRYINDAKFYFAGSRVKTAVKIQQKPTNKKGA